MKYLENGLSIFPIPKPDSKSDNDGKAYDGKRPDIAWSEYQSRMVYGIFRCIRSFLIKKKPLHDLSNHADWQISSILQFNIFAIIIIIMIMIIL